MEKRNYFILFLFFLIAANSHAQKMPYTSHEKEEIKLFNDFKNNIKTCIDNKYDVTDSAQLSNMVSNYVFINSKADSC